MLLAHLQINLNQGKTTDGATPLFVSYQNGHVADQLGQQPSENFINFKPLPQSLYPE